MRLVETDTVINARHLLQRDKTPQTTVQALQNIRLKIPLGQQETQV